MRGWVEGREKRPSVAGGCASYLYKGDEEFSELADPHALVTWELGHHEKGDCLLKIVHQ